MSKVYLDENFILQLLLVAMTKDQKYDFGDLTTRIIHGPKSTCDVLGIGKGIYFTASINVTLVGEEPAHIYLKPVNMKSEELLRIAEIAAGILGDRAKITLTY